MSEYTYNAKLFVTAEQGVPKLVKAVANGILDKYENGVEFIDTTWKGDGALELGGMFTAQSQHQLVRQEFETLSNEITLADNFRQITKGRSLEKGGSLVRFSGKAEAGSGGYVSNQTSIGGQVKAEITPENAFRFNLPVNSRLVVNKVNVQYWRLEECDNRENDIIKISRDNCEFIPVRQDLENENSTVIGYKIVTTVELEKVYDEISTIDEHLDFADKLSFKKVISATANCLVLEFETIGREFEEFIEGLQSFSIEINRGQLPVE